MVDREERCENCRFWKRLERGELYPFDQQFIVKYEDDDREEVHSGECRRNPPVLDGVELNRLNLGRMKKAKICNDDAIHYHKMACRLIRTSLA
jgi:hypothetical protein